MTVTITGTGTTRTITYAKTALTAKITNTSDRAAHGLFDMGLGNHGTPLAPRVYADLTNAEKYAMLDKYITETLAGLAYTYHVANAVDTARATAISTADFDLDK